MVDIDWGEYWWSSVTGPRKVVSSTIRSLRSKRNVILYVPQDLPWRHQLRNSVRNNLESIPGLEDLIVETIDIADENANEIDPGRLILDKYALKNDRNKFRKGGKESIQKYLLRKSVMTNRLVWIKGIAPSCSQKWIEFCEQWVPDTLADGIFVIEVREQPQATRNGCGELVAYEDCVSEYDAQLFNSLIIENDASQKLSTLWKRYAAAITTHLCEADAEVSRSFIAQHNFKKDNPIETISKIAESGPFERRGDGTHVLALYRSNGSTELNKRIWAGQIEVLFPLIERQRLKVVDLYQPHFESEIKKGLAWFNNPIEKSEDIELGTMVYMMETGRLNISDKATQNRIRTLRDCRNQLAHREVCSLKQVAALLGH